MLPNKKSKSTDQSRLWWFLIISIVRSIYISEESKHGKMDIFESSKLAEIILRDILNFTKKLWAYFYWEQWSCFYHVSDIKWKVNVPRTLGDNPIFFSFPPCIFYCLCAFSLYSLYLYLVFICLHSISRYL